jgi:hypothetical protein
MAFHRGPALVLVRVAERTESVAHDEQARHPFIGCPPGEVGDQGAVVRALEVEGIDVLDRGETEVVARDRGKFERIAPALEECPVQRPLGERDARSDWFLECGLPERSSCRQRSDGGECCGGETAAGEHHHRPQ